MLRLEINETLKVKIVIFFSLLFLNLIIAPTIISLVDNAQEIAFFIDINEDEENKGEESTKNLEIKNQTSEGIYTLSLAKFHNQRQIDFYPKKYTSLYFSIKTPPPEFTA